MSGGFDLGPEANDADEESTERVDDPEPVESPSTDASREEPKSNPKEEPQFTSEDVRQFPTYVRDDVLEAFQQTDTVEVQPFLADKGITNVEKRELYDAMFRLATENPEQLAELVIEGRNLDPDEFD